MILFIILWVNSRRQFAWPSVQGVIEKSGLARSSTGEPGSAQAWKAKLQYSYVVNKRTYRGSRIRLGIIKALHFKVTAAAIAARYPEGKKVRVYYHPEKPRTALLEPGQGGRISLMIAILCFVLFSVAIYARWKKFDYEKRQQAKAARVVDEKDK
ncbi:MAG: DUF3592 domain-containing protein [Deltaproteobacteria bacterium]|nr:DUF3592 domain-containing protein [Deltaproteobacteria bacterium]